MLTDDMMAYASYSTGFRGGGFNNRPFSPAQVFRINPETLETYELGLKSQWLDRRLTLNLAGFLSKYHDVQTTVGGLDVTMTPFASQLNIGEATVKGFEAEASFRPASLPGLEVSGSLSYNHSRITEATPPAALTVFPSSLPPVGARLQNIPVWRYNIGAQYAANLGRWGKLSPRVDVAGNSSIYFSALNTPISREPGHTIVNARATWEPKPDLSISAAVTNVFDEFYYQSRLDTYTQGLGYIAGVPSRPREWAMSVRKTF